MRNPPLSKNPGLSYLLVLQVLSRICLCSQHVRYAESKVTVNSQGSKIGAVSIQIVEVTVKISTVVAVVTTGHMNLP